MNHHGSPTVILAKTVKGYGMGANQARNASHQEKKLTDSGLAQFVKRFKIPVPEQQAKAGQTLSAGAGQPGDCLPAGAPPSAGWLCALP